MRYNDMVLSELFKANQEIMDLLPEGRLVPVDFEIEEKDLEIISNIGLEHNVSLDAVVTTLLKLYIRNNKENSGEGAI